MQRRTVGRRSFLAAASSAVAFHGVGSVVADDGYERKYEPVEDPRLDLGAVYIPFLGSKWGNCIDHEPTVGQYEISDEEAVNRHVDQMQGHGLSTLMFNFGEGPKDLDRYRTFREAELATEIDVEAYYTISRVFQRDLDLDTYLDFIREEMFIHPRYNTIDGRPIVQFWASNYIPWHDPTVEEVREEWGGLVELANYIYDRLTVDATEPYIVANVNDVPPGGLSERETRWNRQFDAVSTWFASFDDGTAEWESFLGRTETDFKLLAEFADENDVDFVPTAAPGFNDRPNDCWGDRKLPRSQEAFESMLSLAEDYRTREKVDLATFNGWAEGHQVEPGTFDGTDYGTNYLDVVASFQTHSNDSSATTTRTATTDPMTTATVNGSTGTTTSASTGSATDAKQSSITGPGTRDQSSRTMPRGETTADAESGSTVPGFGMLAGLAGVSLAAYHSVTSRE